MQSRVNRRGGGTTAHLGEVKASLNGEAWVPFRVSKADRHRFIESVPKRHDAVRYGWAGKGMVLRVIKRISRPSCQLVTRHRRPEHGFTRCFTTMDVAVPAECASLHVLNSCEQLTRSYNLQRIKVDPCGSRRCLQFHIFQGTDNTIGDYEISIPFPIGRYDIPGGMLRAGG